MDAIAQTEPRRSGRTIAVVVVAGGRGERAMQASEGPKQYRPIGGKPVIRRTLEAFADNARIGRIVVAIHPDDEALFEAASKGVAGDIARVHGGASRQSSTLFALRALADTPPDAVLIHDAVRPFIDAGTIERVIDAIDAGTGALPALAVSDTLKHAGKDGTVERTVPRTCLFAAQTPQGFPFGPILAAHESAFGMGRADFTDDAAIAEWAGIPVRIVEGAPANTKLTWARDLAMANEKLSDIRTTFPDVRTGNGYDVHSFGEGDRVVLCGVSIPHEKRLSGHSDADVGLHALTDALLATCSAGDIGTHFPPSDPQWKGVSSHLFVEEAARIVREKGGRVANADVTLICEAPRVGGHRPAMIDAMAGMLGVAPQRISVKATTNEKLGFVGRREGIAAIATVSVVYPGEVPE